MASPASGPGPHRLAPSPSVGSPITHVQEVGRARRAFVWVFLGLFTLTGLTGLELWPLTGWKLFIEVREPERTSWQILTVDEEEREGIADFERLPVAYRKAHVLVETFPGLDTSERNEVCRSWAAVLHDHDASIAGVRIYEARTRVPPGPDAPREAPLSRDLVHQCEVGA